MTTPSSTLDKRAPDEKVDEKPLLRAARDGQFITFHLTATWSVSGYLAGIGRFYYVVAVPTDSGATRTQLHKGSVPQIEFHPTRTIDAEHAQAKRELDAMTKSYREWVTKNRLPNAKV